MVYDYKKEVEKDVYQYLKNNVKAQRNIYFENQPIDDLVEDIREDTDIVVGPEDYSGAQERLKGNNLLLVEAIEKQGFDNDSRFLMDLLTFPRYADSFIKDYVLYGAVERSINQLKEEYKESLIEDDLEI